jgi:hypothetical protein
VIISNSEANNLGGINERDSVMAESHRNNRTEEEVYTFKPKINKVSKAIEREKPVQDLLYEEATRRKVK